MRRNRPGTSSCARGMVEMNGQSRARGSAFGGMISLVRAMGARVRHVTGCEDFTEDQSRLGLGR